MSLCTHYYYTIATLGLYAVVLFLYPVAGLLAEVWFSRYRLMIGGTILALIGIIIVVPTETVAFYESHNYSQPNAVCVGLVIYWLGLGLFEANAIQFRTDQLHFASNDKLSVFINWYFWSMYFGNICIPFISKFYVIAAGAAVSGCFTFISISIMLFCCCGCHSHFTTEPVGRVNPVKHIFKVLKYATHHSSPVFRSAFTYGEVPTRLDVAKNRYGGPFTTEEVEDVKTFGRILLVLISLFGFLLLPNSVAVYYYYTYFSALDYIFLFYVNIGYILPVLLILVHMLITRPCFNRYAYRISILNKMGAGLILVVMSLGLMTAVDVSLHYFIESANLKIYQTITNSLKLEVLQIIFLQLLLYHSFLMDYHSYSYSYLLFNSS